MGTGTCAIACSMLPSYREFFGADIDEEMVAITINRMTVHAISMIHDKTVPNGYPEISEKVKLAVSRLHALDAALYTTLARKRKANHLIPAAPNSFSQDMPRTLLRYLATISGVKEVAQMPTIRRNPMDWDMEIISALHNCNPNAIRDLDAGEHRLYINTTITTDHLLNIELKAQETIHPGEVIAYHFGALMYGTWEHLVEDYPPDPQHCTYGEGILSVSFDMYKYAKVPIIPKGTKTGAIEFTGNQIYIIPNRLCALSAATRVKSNGNARTVVLTPTTLQANTIRDPGLVVAEATTTIHPNTAIRLLNKPVYVKR